MTSDSEWEAAAEQLGLRDARRRTLSRNPTRLVCQIGPFDINVRYLEVEDSPGDTKITVRPPPGPWDDHRITVTPGSAPPPRDIIDRFAARLLRDRYLETGDDVFDQRFLVRVRGDRATDEWVGRFLTTDFRRALLDVQRRLVRPYRPPITLKTGRRGTTFHHSIAGRAERESIVDAVRALVACTEVLIGAH